VLEMKKKKTRTKNKHFYKLIDLTAALQFLLLFLELLQLLSLAPRDSSLLADPLQPPELLQGLAVELLLALDAGRVEEPRVLDRLPKIFERNVAVPVGVRGLDETRSLFLDRGFLGENGVRGVVGVEFVRTPVFGRDFFFF
jgi:hypothetical protein